SIRAHLQLAILRRKTRDQLRADDLFRFFRVADLPDSPLLAHRRYELLRAGHSHVGANEFLFHLAQERIIDLPPGDEERAHIGVKNLRGLLESAFELVEGFAEETHVK